MNVNEQNLINGFLALDDFTLLKAFPVLINYKRDIVFTPEIVDYFIENYLEDEDEYIYKIPYSAFKRDQYLNMMKKSYKSDLFSIPHLFVACKADFGIGLMHFVQTGDVFFEDNISESENNKFIKAFARKIQKRGAVKHLSGITNKHINDLAKFFLARTDKISHNVGMTFIELAGRYAKLNGETELDETIELINLILEIHEDCYIELAENYHSNFMYDFIYKLIKEKGQQFVTDKVIKAWNITESIFRSTKDESCYGSSGRKLLMNILDKNGILSATFNGRRVNIYKHGFLKYHFLRIVSILNDVNNFQAYIASTRGNYNG